MSKIFEGVKKFKESDYQYFKSLFQELASLQKPHTLFIGCSDSRVVPDLITNSRPGDLFVVRNIANVVPYYRASSEYLSTTSAIEYAVLVLEVENIIVCGHSNCGGCRALTMDRKDMDRIPHTQRWLELAGNALKRAETIKQAATGPFNFERTIEEENILEQLEHLLTYPFVKDKHEKGQLKIFGWYYDIATCTIYNYHFDRGCFVPIK